MLSSQDSPWVSRTKWLTQALIISGTLNIALIATFAYFVLKDKQQTLTLELKPTSTTPLITNAELLHSYSLLPYQELLLRLENSDHIEEGLTKRDLSLACLVAFHHFNLDKALGGLTLQKRTIPFTEGQETIDIPVFPGLTDYQFLAIIQYAKTEQWPLTSRGLFYELKRSASPRDPSPPRRLLPHHRIPRRLHSAHQNRPQPHPRAKSSTPHHRRRIGKTLSDLPIEPPPPRTDANFLLSYTHSKTAAKLLLHHDLRNSSPSA